MVLSTAFALVAPVSVLAGNEAEKSLKAAQDALAQRNFPLATNQFREVLGRFAKSESEAPAAFGLAVCLIDGYQKDAAAALKLLEGIERRPGKTDPAQVLRYRAAGQRALAVGELAMMNEKDAEARRGEAQKAFREAAKLFVQASEAFEKQGGASGTGREAIFQSTLDAAEMELRTGSYGDAAKRMRKFLDGPNVLNEKQRKLALYYLGFAAFQMNDRVVAERSLSMLAPFDDARFGTHARYLLARLFHLADERAEAAWQYEGVLRDFEREKKEAQAAQGRGAELAKDPVEKLRVEALVRGTTPDHILRAGFYLGVLVQEAGRFADAKNLFAGFLKTASGHPFAAEARLRLGISQVQLREAQEAIAALAPLTAKGQPLAAQALEWQARAAMLLVPEPAQKAAFDKATQKVLDLYRAASERWVDGTTSTREMARVWLDTADAMLQFKRPREAIEACQKIIESKHFGEYQEGVALRLIAAWRLAGEREQSDRECSQFMRTYPQSLHLPLVLAQYAENGFLRALEAEKKAGNTADLTALRAEAVKRCQMLIEKYPDQPQALAARFAVGLLSHRLGNWQQAQTVLDAIPSAERVGDLSMTNFLLADCVLRQIPPGVPEDALTSGKMDAQLKQAAELLDAYAAAQPAGNQTGAALMRLGHALQRQATLQAQPGDRNKLYQEARAAFERLLQPQFKGSVFQPQALLEKARCRVMAGGDLAKSTNELRAFAADPLRKSTSAPLAIVQMTAWMRQQNQSQAALPILAKFAEEYGRLPQADAAMGGLLAYFHGLVLRDLGKQPEARKQFKDALTKMPRKPEAADAAIQWAQCRAEEARKLMEKALVLRRSNQAKETAAADKLDDEAKGNLVEAATLLESEAARFKEIPGGDGRPRLLFEAAWVYRMLGGLELEGARIAMLETARQKAGANAKKLPPREIDIGKLVVQPSEKKARASYLALIEEYGDAPLALEARLELAEILASRNEFDEARKHLADALDREPLPELTEKARLLLGICQAGKGNAKAALAQFDIVGKAPKGEMAGEAKLRAGSLALENKNYAEAASRLAVFRDVGAFQQVPGLTDLGLLRLGHAYAGEAKWDQARQAYERLLEKQPGSRWVTEAQYGVGWAWEQQKQFDKAAASYTKAANGRNSETAAMAQIRVGICRSAQNQHKEAVAAFLTVPEKFGFDDWNSAALLQAAEGYGRLKDDAGRRQMLMRVIVEYPQSPAAREAQERLANKNKV